MSDTAASPLLYPRERRDHWSVRRRFMLSVVIFCKLCIGYVLWKNLDSRVAESVVEFSFLTLISILGMYVFGAAWEDISVAKLVPTGARKKAGDEG